MVLGIIGCGKMAYALLKGIKGSELPFSKLYISDIDPERTKLFVEEFQAQTGDNNEIVEAADVVVIAVKPGQVKEVLSNTREQWKTSKLVISIAAGITTEDIEKAIGIEMPVVRVMPNTPCLVAEGVSAISAGKYAFAYHLELVRNMLNRLGTAVIIEEHYMDAVTAVSGSGPAYAYLVVEAMIDAAIQVGLNRELASQLVVGTIKGSMIMLEETGQHPAVLKAQVCSPGGTTIAGVRQLEENDIRKAFFMAVEEACQRSKELGEH